MSHQYDGNGKNSRAVAAEITGSTVTVLCDSVTAIGKSALSHRYDGNGKNSRAVAAEITGSTVTVLCDSNRKVSTVTSV